MANVWLIEVEDENVIFPNFILVDTSLRNADRATYRLLVEVQNVTNITIK